MCAENSLRSGAVSELYDAQLRAPRNVIFTRRAAKQVNGRQEEQKETSNLSVSSFITKTIVRALAPTGLFGIVPH